MTPTREVEVFTDGACLGNPGPGGWAALLRHGAVEKLLSGGEPATTNNRMELMAAIAALEALPPRKLPMSELSRLIEDAFERRTQSHINYYDGKRIDDGIHQSFLAVAAAPSSRAPGG